ncbi:MAG TPA: ethanolamine ammonia-lyase subunit EutC [Terracidiphilus sp.]|nr:ethanolamine ammonia-lyase subunit EutC [Terracidiphilus sp.]
MIQLAKLTLPNSAATHLRALTPARVGLGRTGVSQQTRDLLDFQRAHAQARDAVHARLDAASLAATLALLSGKSVLRLHSAAPDRATYLQRPDLGRMLDEPSRAALAAPFAPEPPASVSFDVALIVADGLSALAVERHASALVEELLPRLNGWRLAPICIVEQGRVAIGDEIGAALGAQLAVVLIGERPGLSAPDSLGAYLTWQPRPGRHDAERNCISNIRAEGLSSAQAAAQLASLLAEARRLQLTGLALKPAQPQLAEGSPA